MQNDPTRFWARVDSSGGPDTCWPWLGAVTPQRGGYGELHYIDRQWRAHRLAWTLANGRPIPTGLNICHRCDNPPCCNPAHLFPGTALENAHDAMAKGRTARGERSGMRKHVERRNWGARNGHAKLTELQVVEILTRVRAGEPHGEIIKSFPVGPKYITTLLGRHRWGTLTW